MRIKRFVILLTCFGPFAAYCQQDSIQPKAALITNVPFTVLSGGVILLKARFNTLAEPLNFILDTGSGAISLDSATAEEFQISHVPSGRTINGIAGTREVDVAKNNTLHFPGLTVDSLDFYVNDYEILSSVYGEKIDGIIGYSFLHRYIIKLNFDSAQMQVFTRGTITYPRGGTLLHPLFTALPIQSLTLKDKRKLKGNFYIDTGAGLCFLLSKRFEEDSSVLKDKRVPISVQVQGLGGKKEMRVTIIQQLQIGPYRFRKVPTNILDDEFNAISYPFLGGLIGNDILRRFNMILNYAEKEIHLKPNSHFHDEFDYSYTGMNLYYENGVVVADDVVEGSPAGKGGVKQGDVIMAVNSNFTNNVATYRNLMQHVGERINLLVMRDDNPILLSFRVGRIF